MDASGSAGRLAGVAGLAPVPRDSGRISGNMRRPHRPHRRLLRVFHLSARIAARFCSTSKTFCDRERAEGKSHEQAIPALARRRLDVLWALIRDPRRRTVPPPQPGQPMHDSHVPASGTRKRRPSRSLPSDCRGFAPMDANTQPYAMELIRLADPGRSVSVCLRSTEPTFESPGVRYYGAEAVVTSGFVDGTVHLGFDSEDLSDRGRLPDAIEEAEQEADLDEPFTADWPPSGRTAYLRFLAEGPCVVEVHDGTSTQIVVSAPLAMGEGWIAESRERLAAARAALGIGTEDPTAHVPDRGPALPHHTPTA
ncbi:putative protein OS=Streptomyces griseomycini OX=66895 GN=FHS37_006517 PE=4 SV=1 [Streptomyces griseomycini]